MKTQTFESLSKPLLRKNFHRVIHQFANITGFFMRPGTYGVSRALINVLGIVKSNRVVYAAKTLAGMDAIEITPKLTSEADKASKVILFCHGGGFVIGSPKSHQGVVSHIVKAIGIKAFVLDYRLAPEHLYPAPIDDAESAYMDLLSQGYDSKDIIIMGDSAGGGMTLALLTRLRNKGLESPLCGVMLYPWCDYETRLPSVDDNDALDSMCSAKLIRDFADIAFANEEDRNKYSLRGHDLANLPPVLIQTGSHDVLHDDGLEIAGLLCDVKNEGVTEIWQGMTHGWHGYVGVLDESKAAINNIAKFIKEKC